MDSKTRDTEETSILQNSVNRDMENWNEKSGNNSSTEADFLQNYNSPVNQLVKMESRVEEKLSLMANIHRAGNNNGDDDIVGNRTSAPVEQRGDDKSSTSNVHQSDGKKKRRDEISEGDGIIVGGKSIATGRNDMNAAKTSSGAPNRKEYTIERYRRYFKR